MISLLRLIRDHPGAVEADLSRYHGCSLVDFERGRLTLWQVWVRLQHLPLESATARAQGYGDGWEIQTYLVADIYAALAGKPHPADPRTARAERERLKEKRRRVDELAEFERERRERLSASGNQGI